MKPKRRKALRITLPDGLQVRTTDDVVYAWTKLGSHEGWSRVFRPDDHKDTARLLVPKTLDRQLATTLLDSEPEELRNIDLAGAILVLPDAKRTRPAEALAVFRIARINGQRRALNDVTITRASVTELLDMVADHGLKVAARALTLRSLTVREELLERLGHQRVSELLAAHPDLPEEVTWQAMRSRGFDPAQTHVDISAEEAVNLAGNPNLSPEHQDTVIRQLVTSNDPADRTLLARALAAPNLPQKTATWVVARYHTLPHQARVALAANQGASWSWLRQALDSDPDPKVALASKGVGKFTPYREKAFKNHRDPGVRAAGGADLPLASWSWDNPKHVDVLKAVDDPFIPYDWPLQPATIDPTQWGAYNVARHWAARHTHYGEAEKTLRQLVDLHNRSWGAVGKGQGDPALAARSEGARVIAGLTPELQALQLTRGVTYTLEEARLSAVLAVAARSPEELKKEKSPLVAAVLDACAAVAEETS